MRWVRGWASTTERFIRSGGKEGEGFGGGDAAVIQGTADDDAVDDALGDSAARTGDGLLEGGDVGEAADAAGGDDRHRDAGGQLERRLQVQAGDHAVAG